MYLNNAATSYPKPPTVADAVFESFLSAPGDAARGGHGRDVAEECRQIAATLFNVPKSNQVILSHSGTAALNLAILGSVAAGSHVATTDWEHNSVRRPLAQLTRESNVELSYIRASATSGVDSHSLDSCLRAGASTVVLTWASNVTGMVFPIESIAERTSQFGATLIVDASQAAGCISLDYGVLPGRVIVAMAAHKGLLGPAGTGLLLVPDNRIKPIMFGGTGVKSIEDENPKDLPLRYEVGTPNLSGVAGLVAALQYVHKQGPSKLGEHRQNLTTLLRRLLGRVPGVSLFPSANCDGRVGIVAFTLANWGSMELAHALFEAFGIESRGGLQCAPGAHRELGTLSEGVLRISFGPFNTEGDAVCLSEAVARLSERSPS